MSTIHIQNVTKRLKVSRKVCETVFDDFSLSVTAGETLGIFGPNGCGKTTLFNMISGIMAPDCGRICIHGNAPHKARIAYIFQDYRNSLFPWLTIRENIIFPLRIRNVGKREIDDKLGKLLAVAKIRFDIAKYPYQLSGGQQQYVAIMRGLISEPDVMLVDEPFSSLDYSSTMWLIEKIADILGRTTLSSMIVAHDIEHLVYLADRIVFLSPKPAKVLRETTVKDTSVKARLRSNRVLLDEILMSGVEHAAFRNAGHYRSNKTAT
jgi:NitT/TauT family transport system ATP-binding protein